MAQLALADYLPYPPPVDRGIPRYAATLEGGYGAVDGRWQNRKRPASESSRWRNGLFLENGNWPRLCLPGPHARW